MLENEFYWRNQHNVMCVCTFLSNRFKTKSTSQAKPIWFALLFRGDFSSGCGTKCIWLSTHQRTHSYRKRSKWINIYIHTCRQANSSLSIGIYYIDTTVKIHCIFAIIQKCENIQNYSPAKAFGYDSKSNKWKRSQRKVWL